MTAGGPPKVSVVVTCYNLGGYLPEAVDSVLAQTCQDFEILIVDDGSTDPSTRALLADFNRPRTRVMRVPHGGLAAARNVGLANTNGQYLCALDADDRLAASFLAKTVSVLDSDPSVSFVSSWLRNFGEEDWDWTPERCDLPALLCEDTVLTAALVRREAVAAVGGYDTAMPVQGDEDWDLWLTLVERGHRGLILPEILFEYRRRKGSMSSVSWYGSGHMPLANYRIAKHAESYKAHLLDVFRHQDIETSGLLRRNDDIERYIGSQLEPALAARREELEALRTQASSNDAERSQSRPEGPHYIDRAADRVRELEAALNASAAEIAALRASMSWRVTAPLRTIYGWWLALRRSK